MLKGAGQLVHVSGCNIDRHVIGEERSSIAAHCVAPDLNQQRLHDGWIVLLWRHADQIAQRATEAVSYTHLDVYKRQASGGRLG